MLLRISIPAQDYYDDEEEEDEDDNSLIGSNAIVITKVIGMAEVGKVTHYQLDTLPSDIFTYLEITRGADITLMLFEDQDPLLRVELTNGIDKGRGSFYTIRVSRIEVIPEWPTHPQLSYKEM